MNMLRNCAEALLFIVSLLACIALLGVDYDRAEPSPRIFSFAEYSVENNVGLRAEEPQINTALRGYEP